MRLLGNFLFTLPNWPHRRGDREKDMGGKVDESVSIAECAFRCQSNVQISCKLRKLGNYIYSLLECLKYRNGLYLYGMDRAEEKSNIIEIYI